MEAQVVKQLPEKTGVKIRIDKAYPDKNADVEDVLNKLWTERSQGKVVRYLKDYVTEEFGFLLSDGWYRIDAITLTWMFEVDSQEELARLFGLSSQELCKKINSDAGRAWLASFTVGRG